MSFFYSALRFSFLLLVLSCFALGKTFCQTALTPVPGLPTKEIFDLLVDKKGFLWVGHDMGISRYDGIAFTHFAHPARSSLSITDLVEDSLGRIWFHNFTGQVFYIENERIHLLEAYHNEQETYFPRLVLFGNEIVVTSNKGLFVCDTRTLKSRYLHIPGQQSSTQSLSIVGNKVLTYHLGEWFIYDKVVGFRRSGLIAPAFISPVDRNISLQKDANNDTAFLTANPSGTIYKLGIENYRVKLLGTDHVANFINLIQVQNGTLQVHGKETSYNWIGGKLKQTISGKNISDIVVDKQGNTWYGSLSSGLLVQPAINNVSKTDMKFIDKNDFITIITKYENNLLIGTKNGLIAELDSSTLEVIWKYRTQRDLGSVNLIYPLNKNEILVSNSVGTFLLEKTKRKFSRLYSFISKSLVIDNNKLFIASATGLYAFPFPPFNVPLIKEKIFSLKEWSSWWKLYISDKSKEDPYQFYWYLHRSRSLAITPEKELYVSFMNGVFRFNRMGVHPLLYENKLIYSNSMFARGGKVYIGTLNNGLLIKGDNATRRIGIEDGLFSNSIVKVKADNGYLWVMQDRGLQLLDMHTDQIVNNLEFPEVSGANVYDVTSQNDTALLATSEGLFKIALLPSRKYQSLNSMLRLVVVNQKDTLLSSTANLKYRQNDLQFQLAVPWYSKSNSLYFKYRLTGAANSYRWLTTQPGERFIRFASLMPGSYTFEAYAVVAGFQEKEPITFSFTIAKPWWQSSLFAIFIISIIAAGFYAIYRMRFRQVLQLEQVRRSISSDLHDEIGSTISSINIYSELAKSEKQNELYLKLIQENTRDVISKLDDLVWSINPKNDSVHQLLARMQSFAEPVLTGAGIHPHFSTEEEVIKQELSLEKKRNLYLSFKELVNNVVRHSNAQNCYIEMAIHSHKLILTVTDDGVGIEAAATSKNRSGMFNLKERARSTGSTFTLDAAPGKGTKAVLAVPLK